MSKGKVTKYNGKTTDAKIAKVVKKTLAKVSEIKYHDTVLNPTNVTGISSLIQTDLLVTSQGLSDAGNRIGDKITLMSIDLDITLVQEPAPLASLTVKNEHFVRLMLIQWKDNTLPLFSSYLQNVSSVDLAIVTPYLRDTVGKDKTCQVFFDQVYSLKPRYLGGDAIHIKKSIRRGFNKHIQYLAGLTTPNVNDIYLVAFSDFNSAANEVAPKITYDVRCNFMDV